MSARKVARHSGIHYSYVSLVLNGKRSTLSIEIAARIAAALGVKPALLWRPVPSNSKRIVNKLGVSR